MNRRDVIKILTLGIAGLGIIPEVMAQMEKTGFYPPSQNIDSHIKDYLFKIKNFDEPHKNDVSIEKDEYTTFQSTVMRMRRLQEFMGHGHFHLLGFDEGIRMAKNYAEVGSFSREELKFMEKIFYAEAVKYGFFGQKPLKKITERVNKKEVVKIPHSGNYLLKGEPLETYVKIKKQVGEHMILTSGVRGVMKQFLLFLNKAYENEGNLSLASRSLAPPGYSYHSSGDFDVGQIEFGVDNFTARFATTNVYQRLSELGYLKFRYPQRNMLGVRFEPWHIKIV